VNVDGQVKPHHCRFHRHGCKHVVRCAHTERDTCLSPHLFIHHQLQYYDMI